jgi:hypothetical protein
MLIPAGRVRTVAPQFDLVPRLFAMFAAVLAELSVWLDDAFTGRVGALG